MASQGLDSLFLRLQNLLEPYAPHFEPEYWPSALWRSRPGRRVLFADVVRKRTHVSLYIYATVLFPDLLTNASPELMARRTRGKFFNCRELPASEETELRDVSQI